MAQIYFGDPWDVPAVNDAISAPTPLGERCVYCPDVIEEGDQGFLMSAADMGPDGKVVASLRPVHRECMVREIFGSVSCREGRCLCHGKTDQPPEPGTHRDQGRATMTWLRRHGRYT